VARISADVRYRGWWRLRGYTRATGLPRATGWCGTARPLTERTRRSPASAAAVRPDAGWDLAAGLLGRLAASAVLRPVRALAGAVREVSATRDSTTADRRSSGRDELASLAADFKRDARSPRRVANKLSSELMRTRRMKLRTPLAAHPREHRAAGRGRTCPAEQREARARRSRPVDGEAPALVGDLIQATRRRRSVDSREPLAFR